MNVKYDSCFILIKPKYNKNNELQIKSYSMYQCAYTAITDPELSNSYFKSIRNLTRINRILQTNVCSFVYVNILDHLNLISENKSTTNDLSQKVLISHLINGKKTIPFFRLLFWHHSTSWYCMKIITNSFCNLRL